jgi:cell division protein FtsB
VESEHAELKRQQDQAPKSREVLFMEIERLNQLRDKIMNMARSILENSNRQIEKIFR